MSPAMEAKAQTQEEAAAPLNDDLSNDAVAHKSRVTVVGSGNWGSVAAKLIASNTLRLGSFHDEVRMWAYEETLPNGEKLTDVINSINENVKYLLVLSLEKMLLQTPTLRMQ
ncbi:hypothetical protein CIPAW_04G031400 [Carya illinoinensis]|uniref:Glycerol-3-phosphate dehydrogenase NAD-dependent N-terminal domain-containing protein n=1 Tax=Carya illinoinensis TaxID=32201 RepID=A0A8T1QP10_CARIL|nr:hypothetical protein CIPAW_04G031400 [Carya illinoinensis]